MCGNMRDIVDDRIYEWNCKHTTESHEPILINRYYQLIDTEFIKHEWALKWSAPSFT